LKLNELDQHPYWGDDFKEGKCSYFLVEKIHAPGKFIAVITYGDAENFKDIKPGDQMTLQHTQSGAYTETVLRGYIHKDTDVSVFGIDKKVPTWTLK
jgi:hypothetical protein